METKIVCSISFFFQKILSFIRSLEKYNRDRQAKDDNMAHAYGMLDTYGYKHILRICNTYCFSTSTIVKQARLNVTLPVLFSLMLFFPFTVLCTVTCMVKKVVSVTCLKTLISAL
jgi:hypothetical protein